MKKVILILGLVLLVTIAIGGSESGNGARAVIITKFEKIVAVILTDLWEGMQPKYSTAKSGNHRISYKLISPKPEESWNQIYKNRRDLFFQKIGSVSAGVQFTNAYLRFESELASYSKIGLDVCPQRNDVKRHVPAPRLDWFQAIYTHPPTPEDPSKYMCVSKLFKDYADSVNRAAAKFHEVAYLTGSTLFHHTTSDATRRLVSIVFEENFEDLNSAQLENFLKHFIGGDPFPLKSKNSSELPIVSITRPWDLVDVIDRTVGDKDRSEKDYEFGYATSDIGGINEIQELPLENYDCKQPVQIRREFFSNRNLGLEIQLYVVPTQKGEFRYGPGSKWLEDIGPAPFATFTQNDPNDIYSETSINQLVLVRRDQREILWSFGGTVGVCELKL